MTLLRVASWFCLVPMLTACGAVSGSPARSEDTRSAPDSTSTPHSAEKHVGPVGVVFENVNLHVDEAIVLEIRRLNGALIPTRPDQPPIFDDQRSFKLRIDSGEIAMTAPGLTKLMNRYVFAYDGAPLKDLDISIEGGRIRERGTFHKGINIPFSILADVSATSDGRLRLHPTSVKTAGIPAGGLMKMFGLELDEIIKLNRTPGVELRDNDFLLQPGRLLPSPTIVGHLTGVRVTANRIVQVFGSRAATTSLVPPDPRARNYMYYRGGTLQFGKLTMSDADMQLIDADASDAFDFYPARYVRQLVAGYSKNTSSGGLMVYMPDYDQVRGTDLKPSPES